MKKIYLAPAAESMQVPVSDILTSSVGGENGDRYAQDCFVEKL